MKNIILISGLIILAVTLIFASIDFSLYVAYAVLGIGILVFLASILSTLISNIKKNIKSIVAAAILAIVFITFYFIVPVDDVAPRLYESTNTGTAWSPVIGAGLYTVYVLMGTMVLLVIFSQIKKLLD